MQTSVSGAPGPGSPGTGQGFIFYILSAAASGSQTLTFTATGGAQQTQVSYIDFSTSSGCTFSHDTDSPLGSCMSNCGSTTTSGTINAPSISATPGDVLFNFTWSSEHVNDINSPWTCPIYGGQGETGDCQFDMTRNVAAYILSAPSGSVANNTTDTHASDTWQALLTSFSISGSASGTGCPASAPVSGNNCFFISANGSDSNVGTSESSPWQHLPGMASCSVNCAAHTPAPGEGFILRGCDVWGPSDLPVRWPWSGSSGNPITVTVDQSWYNTSNCPSGWGRPVFDGQNSTSEDIFLDLCTNTNCSYDTFDNIEMKRGGGNDLRYVSCYEQCAHVTTSNMYLHAWHVVTDGSCVIEAFYGQNTNLAETSVIDGSDATGASPAGATCYAFYAGLPNVENNVIHDVANGIVGYSFDKNPLTFSGNLIYNIKESNAGSHPNAIEIVTGATYYVHDNVIHDAAGESFMFGNTGESDYVWNNIWYNILGNSPEGPQVPGQSGMSFFAWNNTVVDTAGESCFNWNSGDGGSFIAVTIQNNHCISTASVASSNWGSLVAVQTGNVLMSPSAAAAQGYTASETYAYSPSSSASGTVGKGINIASTCVANIIGLCEDTAYGSAVSGVESVISPVRTPNARPSVGSWDVGAYQFSTSQAQVPQPAGTLATDVN